MREKRWATEEERKAAERERNRRYREANRERVRANQRAYVERHPDRRTATINAYWKKLRTDPVRYARVLAQGRESYARNPTPSYLYSLNWRAENRQRVRALTRESSARRRALVGQQRRDISDHAQVLRRDPCSYCGGDGGVIDHIVPLAGGGDHAVANLAGACRSCNARKRTIPLLRFLLKSAAQSDARAKAA